MAGTFDVGQAQDRMGQALGPALDRMAQQMPENPALDRLAQTQQAFYSAPPQRLGPAFDPTQALDHALSFGGYGGGSGGYGGGNSGPAFDPLAALNATFGQINPFASRDYMMQNTFNQGQDAKAAYAAAAAQTQQNLQPTPKPGPAPNAAPTSGTPANLSPDVARWDGQVQQTFGDLGSWMPNAMLAIIQHESSGSPTAYNAAAPGGAWGLFQQLGLNSNDPNVQMQAARQLAQEKLSGLQDSYAKNGINPDERTRARDLFLAWAGHFDYASGQPNPNSRDVGSGQTADQFLGEIMPMYDNIVRGRQAPAGGAATPGGRGGQLASMFGGTFPGVNQEYGAVTPGIDQGIYGYGAAYGLPQGHTGVDINTKRGSQLYMPAGLTGTVETAGGTPYFRDEDYGDQGTPGKGELRIRLSNGDIVIFGHTSAIQVQAGQQVTGGQGIALGGSANGDHTHLEVRVRQPDGSYRLVNPLAYFGGGQ